MTTPWCGMRVEIVPDDDANARPEIPKSVLEALGPEEVLMSPLGHMMYVRQSCWNRIKDNFPVARC